MTPALLLQRQRTACLRRAAPAAAPSRRARSRARADPGLDDRLRVGRLHLEDHVAAPQAGLGGRAGRISTLGHDDALGAARGRAARRSPGSGSGRAGRRRRAARVSRRGDRGLLVLAARRSRRSAPCALPSRITTTSTLLLERRRARPARGSSFDLARSAGRRTRRSRRRAGCPRPRPGRLRHDLGDQRALARSSSSSASAISGVTFWITTPSQPRVTRPVARSCGQDLLRHVRSASRSRSCCRRRLDRGVDADDLAREVEQRAAGVAGIDRGVGLDEVVVGRRAPMLRPLALTMPAVTVCSRPKGLPIATTQSPGAHRVGVAERQRREPLASARS